MFKYFLVILVFLLSSCSTVERRDCSSLDWYEQGIKDGEEGRRSSYFLQHAMRCTTKPDSEKYTKGRDEGLRFFCSSYGGFKDGLAGHAYLGQCRSFKNEGKFKTAHSLGMDAFRQNEENLDNKEKISELERKIVSEFHNSEELSDLRFDKSILEKDLLRGVDFYNDILDKARSRKYLLTPKKKDKK